MNLSCSKYVFVFTFKIMQFKFGGQGSIVHALFNSDKTGGDLTKNKSPSKLEETVYR